MHPIDNSPIMPLYYGVDIGNSGLRVAELDLAHRELGPMLRINWCPVKSQAIRRCAEDTARFLPDDVAWTRQLRPLISHGLAAEASPTTVWLVSSVRRDALEVLQAYLQGQVGHQIEVVDWKRLPLAIDVEVPERVGIDRLLAALAATELTTERPTIVVQAGSAVTVDLVTSPPDPVEPGKPLLGTFAGGAILPGVPMMLRLLGQGAEQLPEIDADDLLELPSLPGKNTEEAMMCGTASALVGGVAHVISRYRAQWGSDVPVILSGGDGMGLSPYIPAPLIVRPHLVHRGLLRLAKYDKAMHD